MISAESTVDIERPVDEVFAFVSDCRNEPRWHMDVVAAEPIGGEPIGVGTRERWKMFGGRWENIMRVVRFMPNELIELDGERRAMGIHISLRYTIQPVASGSRFSRRFNAEMTGVGRLLEPMYRLGAPRRNRQFTRNLKAVLEDPAARRPDSA